MDENQMVSIAEDQAVDASGLTMLHPITRMRARLNAMSHEETE